MQEIRQQIVSAFRSPPEHVVSRVVTSEIDPLRPLAFSVKVVKDLLILTWRFGLHTKFGC
jgi:hypothetical protein